VLSAQQVVPGVPFALAPRENAERRTKIRCVTLPSIEKKIPAWKFIFIIPQQRALSGVHHIIAQGMCLVCTQECQVVNNGAVSCKSSSLITNIHVLKGDTATTFGAL
jgi:hypothetical protein